MKQAMLFGVLSDAFPGITDISAVEECWIAKAICRQLSDYEGTPDIRLETGIWIEVKAVHHSQEEDERMKRMLTGEVDSGQVTPPNRGLYKKFTDSLTCKRRS